MIVAVVSREVMLRLRQMCECVWNSREREARVDVCGNHYNGFGAALSHPRMEEKLGEIQALVFFFSLSLSVREKTEFKNSFILLQSFFESTCRYCPFLQSKLTHLKLSLPPTQCARRC